MSEFTEQEVLRLTDGRSPPGWQTGGAAAPAAFLPGERSRERRSEKVEGHAVRDAAGRCRRVGEYSTEVQQLTRTRAHSWGRGRTVTCRDGRGWTCCRQMACKRSGVRIPLAPLVRSKIRTDRTASTAAKYSNGGPMGRRTCVRIRHLPLCERLKGMHALSAQRPHGGRDLGKFPLCRGCGSCRLVSRRSLQDALSLGNCCRVCRWSPRCRPKHPKIYYRHPHQPLGARVRGSRQGCGSLRRAAPVRRCIAPLRRRDCAPAHAGAGMNGWPWCQRLDRGLTTPAS